MHPPYSRAPLSFVDTSTERIAVRILVGCLKSAVCPFLRLGLSRSPTRHAVMVRRDGVHGRSPYRFRGMRWPGATRRYATWDLEGSTKDRERHIETSADDRSHGRRGWADVQEYGPDLPGRGRRVTIVGPQSGLLQHDG